MNAVAVLKEKGAQAPGSVKSRGKRLAPASAQRPKHSHELVHWIGHFYCSLPKIQVGGGWFTGWFRLQAVKRLLVAMVQDSGFSCFGANIRRFSWQADHGFTFIAVLGQSAINIHTYPENGSVSVWVITCPGEDDDGSATKRLENTLAGYFEAQHTESEIRDKVSLISYDNSPVGVN